MLPFYLQAAQEFHWSVDEDLVKVNAFFYVMVQVYFFGKRLTEANENDLKALDAALVDAEDNFGDIEVKDCLLSKANFLCRIGDIVINSCMNISINIVFSLRMAALLHTKKQEKKLLVQEEDLMCFYVLYAYLFYFDGKNRLKKLLHWLNCNNVFILPLTNALKSYSSMSCRIYVFQRL
jgi:hypothetical protein